MPKTFTKESVWNCLTDESMGFAFGKPERISETALSAVLPIIRRTGFVRQYVTFPECKKVMVFDTGAIDAMEVKNEEDANVFIRSGTLFAGATQTRALQRSAIVFPGQKVRLAVRCVHRSHGISGGANVKYGGITPLDFDQGVYESGYKPSDQGTYWANVASTNVKMANLNAMKSGKTPKAHKPVVKYGGMGSSMLRRSAGNFMAQSHSHHDAIIGSDITNGFEPTNDTVMDGDFDTPSDHLAAGLDQFATSFDDVLSKVKCHENQVGLAVITQRGTETVELFDVPVSWKALHEDAVKRVGSHLVDQSKKRIFEFKPEHAREELKECLAQDWKMTKIWEHRPGNGEPSVLITGLTGKRHVGESVEVDGNLIHLVILLTN